MPFELSFSPEFFMVEGDDEILPQDMNGKKPISVWQAIMAMPANEYHEMAVDIFEQDGDSLDPLLVLEKIQETRTCTDLRPPVSVWIDEDGHYTVDVWEDDMTETEKVLAEMMQENTGKHFLDSGSTYGRNWERNQDGKFMENTDPVLEEENGRISVSIPTYGFLLKILEYDEDMNHMFESFCEGKDGSYLALMDEFAEMVNGTGLMAVGGPMIVNSYNHESALTQVIQYIYWEDKDNEGHVLLQIHGGCDVRGGYTKPRAFRVHDDAAEELLSNGCRVHVHCDECCAEWMTDDAGYTWEGNSGTRNLEDCVVSAEEPENYLNKSWVRVEEDNFHCPVCGRGFLSCRLY